MSSLGISFSSSIRLVIGFSAIRTGPTMLSSMNSANPLSGVRKSATNWGTPNIGSRWLVTNESLKSLVEVWVVEQREQGVDERDVGLDVAAPRVGVDADVAALVVLQIAARLEGEDAVGDGEADRGPVADAVVQLLAPVVQVRVEQLCRLLRRRHRAAERDQQPLEVVAGRRRRRERELVGGERRLLLRGDDAPHVEEAVEDDAAAALVDRRLVAAAGFADERGGR